MVEEVGVICLGKKVATPLDPVEVAGACAIWQNGALPSK